MKPSDWIHLKCVHLTFVLPGVEESDINSNYSSSSSHKWIIWIKLLNQWLHIVNAGTPQKNVIDGTDFKKE